MIGQPLTRLNFVFRPMRDPLAKGFPLSGIPVCRWLTGRCDHLLVSRITNLAEKRPSHA
jgi:hypothetical protein